MIAKYTYHKVCVDVFYIGITYISTTQVVLDFLKQPRSYVIGKALSHKSICSIRCVRHVKSSKRERLFYGNLPPKNIAELKPWGSVHVDLIGTYRKSIRQQEPGVSIIRNNDRLTCMTMVEPATGWFEIFEIPTFDL